MVRKIILSICLATVLSAVICFLCFQIKEGNFTVQSLNPKNEGVVTQPDNPLVEEALKAQPDTVPNITVTDKERHNSEEDIHEAINKPHSDEENIKFEHSIDNLSDLLSE